MSVCSYENFSLKVSGLFDHFSMQKHGVIIKLHKLCPNYIQFSVLSPASFVSAG